MPETFSGYLKQRSRWAIGCIQMFVKCNPLMTKGLTWAQRVDYFGSVYYFFHGVPRVICLAAPLSALLLGISPVAATVPELVNLFGTYFLASLVMMRTVSRGTRNAFWADVYETAMCFSLSKAALGTMLRPRKPQTFVVTPKGEKLEKRGIDQIATVIPHLILFGLLIAGLTAGIRLWLQPQVIPGLEVSLFWGAANLLLLTLAIFGAHELPQWRNNFRLPRRMPCDLICGDLRISGTTKDMNEHGVRVELPKPVLLASKQVTVYVESPSGDALAMQGIITRQEKLSSSLEVGVNFTEVDQSEMTGIIERMFVHPDCWTDTQESAPGIWKSLWSLVTAFGAPFQPRRPARRQYPRASRELPCTMTVFDHAYRGKTQDISFSGLAVMFDEAFTHVNGRGLLTLKGIVLKVALIGLIRRGGRTIAQFRVESVEKGERQWQALNLAGWR